MPRHCTLDCYKDEMDHFSRNLVPLDQLENNLLPQFSYYHLQQNMSPAKLPPSPPYAARSASPTSDPKTPLSESSSSLPASDSQKCLWIDCTKAFPDPETLYSHLCNDHIGRKSTNNLCLTCKWKDCGTACAKRDHITSHLRGMSPSPLSASSTHSSPPLPSSHPPKASRV